VVHYGSEYTLIGFKGCSGGRFSADPAAEDPKAVDGAVIEFELEEDPELIRFALSEVATPTGLWSAATSFPQGSKPPSGSISAPAPRTQGQCISPWSLRGRSVLTECRLLGAIPSWPRAMGSSTRTSTRIKASSRICPAMSFGTGLSSG